MENYIVSARKYRPQTFESVVGQQILTQTLKNAIASGKLAHAYLFCGPRGVGKTTCARIFAKTINCFNPTEDGEACNECESCKAFNENRSMNIFELDAASNNSINDIRSIVERVNIPPQIGRYKVFIIDEVHMLSQAAFNAFLKTLEEPPAHVIFIMATTEKHKVIPTILSRCQIYDFQRMDLSDIVNHLRYVAKEEGIQAENEALSLIAQKADGGMRDALSIFDQVCNYSQGHVTYQKVIEDLNILDYDYYFRATEDFLAGKYKESLLLLNEVIDRGFNPQQYIGGLASHFRDLLVARDSVTLPLLEVGEEIQQRYHEQAKRCNPRFLYKAIKICSECDAEYRTSRNKRLTVELALIQLSQIEQPDLDNPSGLGPTTRLKPLTPSEQPTTQPHAQTEQRPAPTQSFLQPAPQHPHTTNTVARTVSIKRSKNTTTSSTPAEPPTKAQPAPSEELNNSFSEEDVRDQWIGYSLRLPQEESAMQSRMALMQPKLVGQHNVEVCIGNELVLKDISRLKPSIEQYLRTGLKNSHITLSFQLVKYDENNKPRSRQELYKSVLEENPDIKNLCKELSLTLY
ncbi:MAG: DNA polymerase III subunit gamma/tau [Alloprevotella sp.]|nr:DNA polymerase III subunit gamma/tau [Alloprevotella sp.]